MTCGNGKNVEHTKAIPTNLKCQNALLLLDGDSTTESLCLNNANSNNVSIHTEHDCDVIS